MGVSGSSLLDEAKSNYIKGQAEAELKEFKPYYTKQFSVARFAQAEDDLEQNKQKITQLLKQRESNEEAAVLYEDLVLYFDETRKWRDRYMVVRANYCLECHDSLETFVKGVPPRQKLLPTGGAVLTAEDAYMAMVDKCFPDDGTVKEDFVPPLSGMPGQFPVYLRLPYRRDSYFCFRQEVKQSGFLSILSDCIRHQNQDFLKKKTCEVQAFLKAIQLYREDKGKFHAWDMLIGSDVRVMANLVMEKLLPSLEKDMLPRLKAKKTEKKRVWFATVEAAYVLVQEQLLSGLSELKEECRTSVRRQEVLIHSDMDQILTARKELEDKIRVKVSGPAEKLCSEAVQPYLGSVLEELMEPISSGFQEGRRLSEDSMDEACHSVLQGGSGEELKKTLSSMAKPDLQSCYRRIGSLQEKLQQLQERFGFCNVTGMIQSAQIDLQQLMENAAFTFEEMFQKAVQDHPDDPDNAASAIEKAKHRILKQYDYDSSSVRKKIFQDALVSITLPFIKKDLASTYKTELQGLQQLDSDHSAFVHVDNIYEDVLLQILDKEVTKVVKEAASLKKYNLVADSRDLLSQSSRSSLSSPVASTPDSPSSIPASPATVSIVPASPATVSIVPASPATVSIVPASPATVSIVPASPANATPSPLTVNGLSSDSGKTSTEPTEVQIPPKEKEEVDSAVSEVEPPAADVFQTIKAEPEACCSSLVPPQSPSAPEIVIHHQVVSGQKDESEPEMKNEAEISLSESAADVETVRTNQEGGEEAQVEAPGPGPGPEPPKEVDMPSTEGTGPDQEPGNQSTEGAAAASEPETSPDPPKEADKTAVDGLSPDGDPEPSPCPEPPKEAETPSLDPEPKPSPDPSLEAVTPSFECPDPEPEPSPSPGPLKEADKPPAKAPGPDPEPSPVPDLPKEADSDCPDLEPVSLPAEGPGPCPVVLSSEAAGSQAEETPPCEIPDVPAVAPPGDEAAADVQSEGDKEESATASDPNSLDVSVGSDSPPSDLDSTDEVSTTSDVLEDGATLSRSPESSDVEDKPPGDEQTATTSPLESPAEVRADVEAGASVEAEDPGAASPPPQSVEEERTPEEERPLDCVKEIRDLVAEVIEVEELAQRYPDGIPKEE